MRTSRSGKGSKFLGSLQPATAYSIERRFPPKPKQVFRIFCIARTRERAIDIFLNQGDVAIDSPHGTQTRANRSEWDLGDKHSRPIRPVNLDFGLVSD